MARPSTSKPKKAQASGSGGGASGLDRRSQDAHPQSQEDEAKGALVDVDCEVVFERFPEAALLVRRDGGVLVANRGAEELTGFSAVELVSRRFEGLVALEGKPLTVRRLVKLAANAPDQHEAVLRHSGGTEVPISLSVSDISASGQPLVAVVLRDISEQKATLARLNEAIQHLQFHVDRMPLAYIVWDRSFRVVDWNPAAERIFGYSRKQALGRHAYELIVPESAQPLVDKVWEELLRGDTTSHSINPNRRRDGTTLTCEWFNTPLRSPDKTIAGVASMAMDVSERARLEERIRDAQKLESLGILASGIAHDFNSSLMVILGNAALLRSVESLPAQCSDHLDLIEDASSRANELVKHLLAYARTGRHNPQPTQINSVIQEAETFVRSSLGPNYKLSLMLDDAVPLVHADRSQLEQVVLNLCMNAAQAMEAGGQVQVETHQHRLSNAMAAKCVPFGAHAGDYVELVVRDTGCGMDRERISRIFDPFFSTKADGHGLGLAAVLGILRQHNAVARVVSKAGRGTDFHVYFPLAATGGT